MTTYEIAPTKPGQLFRVLALNGKARALMAVCPSRRAARREVQRLEARRALLLAAIQRGAA